MLSPWWMVRVLTMLGQNQSSSTRWKLSLTLAYDRANEVTLSNDRTQFVDDQNEHLTAKVHKSFHWPWSCFFWLWPMNLTFNRAHPRFMMTGQCDYWNKYSMYFLISNKMWILVHNVKQGNSLVEDVTFGKWVHARF